MSDNPANVDWDALAIKLGRPFSGSTDCAQQVIPLLPAENWEIPACEYYVSSCGTRPGCELLRMVMLIVRPTSALDWCLDFAYSESRYELRSSALDLMRMMADRTCLSRLVDLLNDPNQSIQNATANIIEQISVGGGGFLQADITTLISLIEAHKNSYVVSQIQRAIDETVINLS